MARAIHVAVRLELPDLLANGPKGLSELALATGSDLATLHRLLRCLKHLGIIMETSPEVYSSTPSLSDCSATAPIPCIGWQCYMVRSGSCAHRMGWRIESRPAF